MTLQQLLYTVKIAETKSMNKAAAELFISQPALSSAIHELEEELQIEIFIRTQRGIIVTTEGENFLSYARQIVEMSEMLKERYASGENVSNKFSVSMQHYSFAVMAFVRIVKKIGTNQFDFAVYETKTYEVIENVRDAKSELGILYINEFNQQVLNKLFRENQLVFVPLFDCDTYVYLKKGHPLSDNKVISMKDLEPYTCLAFDQGKNNSFYLAEEMMSTYDYKKIIRANDRATMLNLLYGIDGYTLCSGVICDALNGDDVIAIPLKESEKMTIGYIHRKGAKISPIGEMYLEELVKYLICRDK